MNLQIETILDQYVIVAFFCSKILDMYESPYEKYFDI